MEKLDLYVESVLFAAREPVSFDQLHKLLTSQLEWAVDQQQLRESLTRITEKYQSDRFPFEIISMNHGYVFMSKPEFHPLIAEYLKLSSGKKLTKTAMETLAIVAYKQPVTRLEISNIRGVNADYIIQKLLEKDLIAIAGRSEEVGRPLLYKTSERFLEYFGLKDISELPKLREILTEGESEAGEHAPIEGVPIEQKLTNESSNGDHRRETTDQ